MMFWRISSVSEQIFFDISHIVSVGHRVVSTKFTRPRLGGVEFVGCPGIIGEISTDHLVIGGPSDGKKQNPD
jgi:hypothetical protein